MRRVSLALAAVCAATLLAACSKPKPQVRTYQMGEKFTVGHMVYTVFESKLYTHLGQQPSARVPKDRFLLIRLNAVNGGGGDVLLPAMTLEDDNGNTYPALTNGEGVPSWIGSLRKISPADIAQGWVAFDAPAKHYRLRLTDENDDEAAYVDIPLTFESETPVDVVPPPQKTQ